MNISFKVFLLVIFVSSFSQADTTIVETSKGSYLQEELARLRQENIKLYEKLIEINQREEESKAEKGTKYSQSCSCGAGSGKYFESNFFGTTVGYGASPGEANAMAIEDCVSRFIPETRYTIKVRAIPNNCHLLDAK
ncbi:MAG: hypothetical protein SGJ18_06985 [Pseudomonadota bacterium]|nr:hypothetical protein [Pseudomonadota bacterium]